MIIPVKVQILFFRFLTCKNDIRVKFSVCFSLFFQVFFRFRQFFVIFLLIKFVIFNFLLYVSLHLID